MLEVAGYKRVFISLMQQRFSVGGKKQGNSNLSLGHSSLLGLFQDLKLLASPGELL